MKFLCLLCLFSLSAFAQGPQTPVVAGPVTLGTPCIPGSPFYANLSIGVMSSCQLSGGSYVWTQVNAQPGQGLPGGANGQIEYNNNGFFGGFTANGDCTITPATGAVNCAAMNYNGGQTGMVSRPVQSKLGDFLSVKDFGAVGDGVANDTAAIVAACTAVAASKANTVFFPLGTYLTDPITNCNYYGLIIQGASPVGTTFKSRTGQSVFVPTGPQVVHGTQYRDFHIDGSNGASNLGFDLSQTGGYNTKISNVIIDGVGGQCIYQPTDTFTSTSDSFEIDIDHVECKSNGSNGIEISGGPASVIQNSYVHQVGPNMSGYWCYSACTMLNDNGLDGGPNQLTSTWMTIGRTTPIAYGFVTFINCNIEFFGLMGIHVLNGSFKLEHVSFTPSMLNDNSLQAIRYESPFFQYGISEFDAQTGFGITDPSSGWLNGYAIHYAGNGCPTILMWSNNPNNPSQCYSEGLSIPYNIVQASYAGLAVGTNTIVFSQLQGTDLSFGHRSGAGAAPTINASFPFCTGSTITGHDAAGSVTVGSGGGCGSTGQVVFAKQWRGNLACNAYLDQNKFESGSISIATASGGISVATWISGTQFNTGWTSGMPITLYFSGTAGGTNYSQTVQANPSSATTMNITPGFASPVASVAYSIPNRASLWYVSAAVGAMTIRNSINFVAGDTIRWNCTDTF